MGWWETPGGGGEGMVRQPWEADGLGSSGLWGSETPLAHSTQGGHPCSSAWGGVMLQGPGCETPQKFGVQRCSKGPGCQDTPKVLGAEVLQSPGCETPQMFWVRRCSKGPGCRDTPKVLGVEVLQRCWVQ